MRKTLSLAAVVAALALGAVGARASTPAVTIANEPGSVLLNAPMLGPACTPEDPPQCTEAPLQLNGRIDGTASSDVAIEEVRVTLVGNTGSTQGDYATVTCEEDATCTWTFSPDFILPPGIYDVTATARDVDGAEVSANVSLVII